MAATIPPDVSLTLTIGPELDVEQLVVDTTEVLVTTVETPLLLSLGVVQGEAGYVGPPGPPGEAATCDAGSTVTLPPGSFAKVINVGSKDAAIFDFEIPQGVAGPVGPAGPMLWVPYTGSGQSFVLQNLTRDGDWTMCANKNTSDRPAPQASGTEEDLLPPWTPASSNARATYTVYNEWTLNQSGWLDQYGIDILAQNLSALHQVTLTVNGVVKDHISFTPNGPEVFWINITPLLVVSGAVVRVTLQVSIVANNLMYWLQQTALFATAPSYCSLAVGSKDGAAAGTTAYGCHVIFIPGAASPDWDIVAYGGTASPGSGTAPPLADTTQDGLLRKVSGLTTDFVDGSNHCQNLIAAVPLASATQSGLLRQVSGLTTDFVDGTNTCQGFATRGNTLYVQRAGDTLPNNAQFLFSADVGLTASSWQNATVRISCSSTTYRPQLAFVIPGYATCLYLETDYSLRHIGSDGTTRVLWDDHHNNSVNSGQYFYIGSGGNLVLQSGGSGYVDGGLAVRTGGTLTCQSGSNVYIQGASYVQNNLHVQSGGYLYIDAGGYLNVATGNNLVTVTNECGLAGGSYSAATLRIYTVTTGGRPGISFHHAGLGYACFLYMHNDGKFHFIDSGGVDHLITSS